MLDRAALAGAVARERLAARAAKKRTRSFSGRIALLAAALYQASLDQASQLRGTQLEMQRASRQADRGEH